MNWCDIISIINYIEECLKNIFWNKKCLKLSDFIFFIVIWDLVLINDFKILGF